jgi:predicted alpha/beta hydrolase family esterase
MCRAATGSGGSILDALSIILSPKRSRHLIVRSWYERSLGHWSPAYRASLATTATVVLYNPMRQTISYNIERIRTDTLVLYHDTHLISHYY